jgi:hypothetical protein
MHRGVISLGLAPADAEIASTTARAAGRSGLADGHRAAVYPSAKLPRRRVLEDSGSCSMPRL